jgi:Zn-dependent peptidase ImmA (M78 family)
MRLPRTLVFPFGYRVTVKLVTTTEMAEMDDGGADGLWLVDRRTIFLSKAIPVRRRRAVLIHEMMHALLDYQHEMLDLGVARN